MLLVETFQFKQENKMKEGVIERRFWFTIILMEFVLIAKVLTWKPFMKKQVTDSIRKKLPALNVVQ